MNEGSLMERFANPELFETLSFGDKMVGGLVTLVMGMGITFIILAIIWGCIALMGVIFRKMEKKPAPKEEKPVEAPVEAEPERDEALVAVIMAAIVAYEGETNASNLRISRITRVGNSRTSWNKSGLNECIDSRRW